MLKVAIVLTPCLYFNTFHFINYNFNFLSITNHLIILIKHICEDSYTSWPTVEIMNGFSNKTRNFKELVAKQLQ